MSNSSLEQQTATRTTTSNTDNTVSGINKYKGICCKNKYEYPWLKNETCCFCCGVRCALLTLCIFMMIDAVQEIGIAIFFLTGGHRSLVGCAMNLILGLSGMIVGIIGYIAIKTNKQSLIRLFWYITIAGIFGIIGVLGFAVVEFIILKQWVLVIIMSVDFIFAGFLWIYICYKVKRYYDLAFSYYHELSDGTKQEQQQTDGDNKTVEV